MAEHGRWVRERVAAALAKAAEPATEWIDQAVIDADSETQRERLEQQIDKPD